MEQQLAVPGGGIPSGSAPFNHHSHLTTKEEWLIRADAKTDTFFLLRKNLA
jgi:hypothetical protein